MKGASILTSQPSVPGRLVLICGLPGAGKTTLARRLAVEYPAIRLCPDEWMAALGMDLHDEPARARLEQTLWLHTRDLLRLGQTVILEYGFWARDERDDKRQQAHTMGATVELHALDLPLDQLWQRVEHRNGTGSPDAASITREQLSEYSRWWQAPEQAELDLFDPPLQP